jgi:hypothetical protein
MSAFSVDWIRRHIHLAILSYALLITSTTGFIDLNTGTTAVTARVSLVILLKKLSKMYWSRNDTPC